MDDMKRAGGMLHSCSFTFCAFNFLRAAIVEYVLKSFSISAKIPNSKIVRFAEQGWLAVYYVISFGSGLVNVFLYFGDDGLKRLYHSPTWGDTSYFWRNYPRYC
jgi:acyl-CoA-dependent ceramide synthase